MSVTVMVTFVLPTRRTDPDGGSDVIVVSPRGLLPAGNMKSTAIPFSSVASTTMSDGHGPTVGSMQSGTPFPFASMSGVRQPHTPGAILLGSFGQPSATSGTPSPSVS